MKWRRDRICSQISAAIESLRECSWYSVGDEYKGKTSKLLSFRVAPIYSIGSSIVFIHRSGPKLGSVRPRSQGREGALWCNKGRRTHSHHQPPTTNTTKRNGTVKFSGVQENLSLRKRTGKLDLQSDGSLRGGKRRVRGFTDEVQVIKDLNLQPYRTIQPLQKDLL